MRGASLAGDREWFIQKAIGWWLREFSKRDANRVRRFLAEHGAALKVVARSRLRLPDRAHGRAFVEQRPEILAIQRQ